MDKQSSQNQCQARIFSVPLPEAEPKTKQAVRTYLVKNFPQQKSGMKDSERKLKELKLEEKQASTKAKAAKDKLAQALFTRSEKLKEIRKAHELETQAAMEELETKMREEHSKKNSQLEEKIQNECKLEYEKKFEEEMVHKRKRDQEEDEKEEQAAAKKAKEKKERERAKERAEAQKAEAAAAAEAAEARRLEEAAAEVGALQDSVLEAAREDGWTRTVVVLDPPRVVAGVHALRQQEDRSLASAPFVGRRVKVAGGRVRRAADGAVGGRLERERRRLPALLAEAKPEIQQHSQGEQHRAFGFTN